MSVFGPVGGRFQRDRPGLESLLQPIVATLAEPVAVSSITFPFLVLSLSDIEKPEDIELHKIDNCIILWLNETGWKK